MRKLNISIGSDEIPRLGYGCMGLTQAYAPVEITKAKKLLQHIVGDGPVMLDTAATYSGGRNESLVGSVIKTKREHLFLASKAGLYKNPDGSSVIDGDPERIIQSCEESLSRLRTEVIDLFYLHRVDPLIPIEESVGAIGTLVEQGKVRYAGLSEVSQSSLIRASSVTRIDAVQSEYSIWSRRVEDGISRYCKDHEIALIAYSPVGRGFLAGGVKRTEALTSQDIRRTMPRFQEHQFDENINTLDQLELLAIDWDMTPAQLSLNWIWSQGAHIAAIPGTSSLAHWKDNQKAQSILDTEQLDAIEAILLEFPFVGDRYTPDKLLQLDSERNTLGH